jgi:hypothetical protein
MEKLIQIFIYESSFIIVVLPWWSNMRGNDKFLYDWK